MRVVWQNVQTSFIPWMHSVEDGIEVSGSKDVVLTSKRQ